MTDKPLTGELPGNPQDLLADTSKTREEKLRLLEDWRLDLLERQRATEENMPATDDNNTTATLSEQLRLVSEALAEIRKTEE